MSEKEKKETTEAANEILDEQQEEIVEDLDEAEEIIPFTYSISSYCADYPIDSLIKRMEAKDVLVPIFSWEPQVLSKICRLLIYWYCRV